MNALAKYRAERDWLERHPGQAYDEGNPPQGVEYSVENYLQALPDLKLLYPEHWREIARDHDLIPLEPDYPTYEALAKMGALHLVTVRADGELVGYTLGIIRPHLHYKSSLTYFGDIFYLRPKHRTGWCGYRLLKQTRDTVQQRGVQKIYLTMKLAHDIEPLLRRLGFDPIERTYSKVFR